MEVGGGWRLGLGRARSAHHMYADSIVHAHVGRGEGGGRLVRARARVRVRVGGGVGGGVGVGVRVGVRATVEVKGWAPATGGGLG